VKKIPYMLIVGEKEVLENKVSIRKHGQGDQGSLGVDEFAEAFRKECAAPF
jgi:threonyl-tRNA synthetase